MIKDEFTRGPLSRALAVLAYPVLARFKRRVDPRRYNGASLLGLRGIVIKSHGSADAYGFEQAIRRACEAARHRLLERTIAAMQPFLAQLGAAPPPAGAESQGDEPVGSGALADRVAVR
jgi:glycerol-3-phosphate acyltransferase PlsX